MESEPVVMKRCAECMTVHWEFKNPIAMFSSSSHQIAETFKSAYLCLKLVCTLSEDKLENLCPDSGHSAYELISQNEEIYKNKNCNNLSLLI